MKRSDSSAAVEERARSRKSRPSRPTAAPTGPPQPDQGDLPPEEWDFRRVREDQLDAVILYEYARSCDWVREVFDQWHRMIPVKRPGRSTLRQWAGMTIRQFIDQAKNAPSDTQLPDALMSLVADTMPAELETAGLQAICNISPRFPTPFLKLQSPMIGLLTGRLSGKTPAFIVADQDLPSRLLKWNLQTLPAFEEHVTGVRFFYIAVDLRFSKTMIKDQMAQWIDSLDATGIDRLTLPKGRAAEPPWFRLKELAAYRLSKMAKMKYERAQAFVREHQKKLPSAESAPVLPLYTPGAFSDAVKSASHHILHLFPIPEKASPEAPCQ